MKTGFHVGISLMKILCPKGWSHGLPTMFFILNPERTIGLLNKTESERRLFTQVLLSEVLASTVHLFTYLLHKGIKAKTLSISGKLSTTMLCSSPTISKPAKSLKFVKNHNFSLPYLVCLSETRSQVVQAGLELVI